MEILSIATVGVMLLLVGWGMMWRRRAKTDFLTNLANYYAFSKVLPTKLKQGYWVLLLDICDFASYNQELGYTGADRVLQGFAASLSSAIGKEDLLFRYRCGDEFVLFLLGDEPYLLSVIEKIKSEDLDFSFVYSDLIDLEDILNLEKELMKKKKKIVS